MTISREELLHIANLASLNIKEEEVEKYLTNLQDILNYANLLNKAPIKELPESINKKSKYNVFRRDEIQNFKNIEGLMANAPEKENNMFKIPKVI